MSFGAQQLIAKKEYACEKCHQPIQKGQEYRKRMHAAKVHGMTSYFPSRWHATCPQRAEE